MSRLPNLLRIKNNQSIDLGKIENLTYADFYALAIDLLKDDDKHCTNYFAYPYKDGLQFIMAIADDVHQDIIILSHILKGTDKQELKALTKENFALHIFEREIYENYGVYFTGHPWLKPLRFAHDRALKEIQINDYPFYKIKSEELHEVGVGPIHAGIIEPGHFRFICNGENVLHLEIQLGWQHRGIEKLILDKENLLQRTILAESIAGDTVIGHTLAFVQIMESLSNKKVDEQIHIERSLALELERIAIHIGDISALCVDAAYYLGANLFGVLRTPIINFLQLWSGNRFGKSLIRPGGTNYPFTDDLKQELWQILDNFEQKFEEIAYIVYRLPSIQNRFDFVGTVTKKQAKLIGTVGLSARMSDIKRDIRMTHPNIAYKKFPYETVTVKKGDVFARFLLKKKEIRHSIAWIRNVLSSFDFNSKKKQKPNYNLNFKANSLSISLVEGWRGEICHCALTN